MDPSEPLVGLLPAAGHGSRLGRLPCSKELLPLGAADGGPPQPVSRYLLEELREAGVARAFWLLRAGKWDIAEYYGGALGGLELAYRLIERSGGVPHTLDAAYPFVRGSWVALGLPDILYPPGAFAQAVATCDGQADAWLGLFPALEPARSDMVAVDEAGFVREVAVKPAATALSESWGLALWSPRFTEFLHAFVARCGPEPAREVQLGHAFAAALRAGLVIGSVRFPDPFLDIGTPQGYQRALRHTLQGGS